MKKRKIRIYRKFGEYEYYDVSKNLRCFYYKRTMHQYVWVAALGIHLENFGKYGF